MEQYEREYQRWMECDSVPKEMKEELSSLDETGKKVRFSSYMSFGTAGLRAKMGAGTSMMNLFTVAHTTAGLAKLIRDLGEDACRRGVVIAYDSRNNSKEFALRSAAVLFDYDIKVYLFDAPRPTPELSFAVRELGCIAGINITASHNPKEYNGYKVYGEDGAQLDPAHADKIS